MQRTEDLERIRAALEESATILGRFSAGAVEHRLKQGGDPLTEADTEVNDALRKSLPRPGEGWLSEESADDLERRSRTRVWIVDPLDGTREFVEGIPEWCVSVGLVESGRAVAGGIFSPSTGRTILGSLETGVSLNGQPCTTRPVEVLEGVEVLASRSETKRGEWKRFDSAPFGIRPMGSVAYKMGLVAAGLADATWTLLPKHEWDVAAGTALVEAAGGEVRLPDGSPPVFNQEKPLFGGLLAAPRGMTEVILRYLREHPADPEG